MNLRFTLLAAACTLAGLQNSRATLYAYDGFDYFGNTADGSTLVGRNPSLHSAGSSGLNGTLAGAVASGQGGLSNFFLSTGLTFGPLHVRGGTARYNNVSGQASYLAFKYSGASVNAGTTLYTSYLVRALSPLTDASVISLRLNGTQTSASGTSYFVTAADSATAGSPPGAQYDTTLTSSGTAIQPNTTYLVIGKFTNVGTSTGPREATTYILNEAQFEHYAGGGFGETEWDSATIGTGVNQVVARVNEAYTGTNAYTLAPNNGIQFGIGNGGSNNGLGQDILYDELRCASTLAEVVPTGPQFDPVSISLTVTTPVATEPTATTPSIGRITLSRQDASTRQVTVHFAISGTATIGVDTYPLPSSATLPENAASTVIEIRPLGDRIIEGDETITLTARSLPGGYVTGTPDSATVSILDGPPAPTRLITKLSEGLPQKLVVYGTSLTAGNLWPPQLKASLDSTYPGQLTLINSGGSGENSVWGLINLTSKVINQNPDTVFIEFAVNDAVIRESYTNRINPAQARANLNTMINRILEARPNCEIILQVMSPVIGDSAIYRPNLALCQQIYRDVGKERGLLVIDHMPAWQALLDQGTTAFTSYVPDGLHPAANGYSLYATPVMLAEIGATNGNTPNTVFLNATNQRTAEPVTASGSPRTTHITVTRQGSTDNPLVVPLIFGGTAVNGTDYAALPSSVTIPAGKFSASIEMIPTADTLAEGEETFTVAIASGSGYATSSPSKASLLIEDRPFDHWRKNQFTAADLLDPLISGDSADPDEDGIPNLLEFLTGHAPKSANRNEIAIPGTETLAGQKYLTLTYNRVPRNGITGVAQTSVDLTIWRDAGFIQETVLDDNGLLQNIKARSLTPIGNNKEFIRLKALREP